MQRVFVIRGFGRKTTSAGQAVDFERVHDLLIAPAVQRCGLTGGTTAQVIDAGNIRADMFALILEADLVVCDITVHNANVFYELGIRHALRKKHTVLIKGDPSADVTPFDLSTDRYLKYPIDRPADALDALVATLQASLRSDRETDSPIFQMLPRLAEAEPGDVVAVPLDFLEEVQRAEAAGDRGWLRVIAADLRGQRFQWEGLRRVARSQWGLGDLDGARDSWEALRQADGTDVEATLALASVYERAFRQSRREELMAQSHQCIRQVLEAARATPAQRAEARALESRNHKTLWRERFDGLDDPAAVQPRALDARALKAYQSYRDAYAADLNAFYPGLAALQMGHILGLLSGLPGWRGLFKGQALQAERARQDLLAELPVLTHVVAASIQRARSHGPEDERVWADIAEADLLFLTMGDDEIRADVSPLVQAYQAAIPPRKRFAWGAIHGQLALFARLGFRPEAVAAVVQALGGAPPAGPARREHLVVFAGHRADGGPVAGRFPAEAEPRVRAGIAERLAAWQRQAGTDVRLTVLASAAPGADILLHEVCAELGLPSRLCLPMPPDDLARLAYADAGAWHARFQAVVQAHAHSLLRLSADAELPRWLQGRPGVDPWERGNRWVVQLAQGWGAERVSLLVLWDGRDDGRTGGTAHLVRLARQLPGFEIEVIDSRAGAAT